MRVKLVLADPDQNLHFMSVRVARVQLFFLQSCRKMMMVVLKKDRKEEGREGEELKKRVESIQESKIE